MDVGSTGGGWLIRRELSNFWQQDNWRQLRDEKILLLRLACGLS